MNDFVEFQNSLRAIAGILLLIFAMNRFGRKQKSESQRLDAESRENFNPIREERQKKHHGFRKR